MWDFKLYKSKTYDKESTKGRGMVIESKLFQGFYIV